MASVKDMVGGVLGLIGIRELTVASVQEISPRFRRFELVGEGLRGASCAAGDKVQVMLGGGARTYSPFAFDPTRGALSFLVYLHGGESPGAAWGKQAAAGDRVRVFGPRGSLALGSIEGPVVLVGDETSFAVARSLYELRGNQHGPALVFEVSEPDEAERALAALGLQDAELVVRQPGDAHLAQLETSVRAELAGLTEPTLVLTGRAAAIQSVRSALKRQPPRAKYKTKAYWAPGKRGLD